MVLDGPLAKKVKPTLISNEDLSLYILWTRAGGDCRVSKLHKVRVKQISLFRLFQFSEALYAVPILNRRSFHIICPMILTVVTHILGRCLADTDTHLSHFLAI